MGHTTEVLRSTAQTLLRAGAGHRVVTHSRAPDKMLTLYEFEGCPFCRRVREALSALDIDAKIVPCPKGGKNRAEAVKIGGKTQFPLLVDPNTETVMYESNDIIAYLKRTYAAEGAKIWQHGSSLVQTQGQWATQKLQEGHGRTGEAQRQPKAPLELWSFEASPFCRLVREALCELELVYILHNVARGGQRREAHERLHGSVKVPYLEDPNTQAAMYESREIVAYLRRTYGS